MYVCMYVSSNIGADRAGFLGVCRDVRRGVHKGMCRGMCKGVCRDVQRGVHNALRTQAVTCTP